MCEKNHKDPTIQYNLNIYTYMCMCVLEKIYILESSKPKQFTT